MRATVALSFHPGLSDVALGSGESFAWASSPESGGQARVFHARARPVAGGGFADGIQDERSSDRPRFGTRSTQHCNNIADKNRRPAAPR
eukprot:3524219-Pyramimonas_sp.AAC.1